MTESSRERLRPWLQGIVNEGRIAGVEWIDREDGTFKIPWHSLKRSDTNPAEDLRIFVEWAIQNGRHVEGRNSSPDYKSFKEGLRNALNRSPSIREVKNLRDVSCPTPYRVYQFVDPTGIISDDAASTSSAAGGVTTQDQPIAEGASMSPDLGNLPSDELQTFLNTDIPVTEALNSANEPENLESL